MNLSFLLNLALPLIRNIVKNPAQKRKMRNLMLEILQASKPFTKNPKPQIKEI